MNRLHEEFGRTGSAEQLTRILDAADAIQADKNKGLGNWDYGRKVRSNVTILREVVDAIREADAPLEAYRLRDFAYRFFSISRKQAVKLLQPVFPAGGLDAIAAIKTDNEFHAAFVDALSRGIADWANLREQLPEIEKYHGIEIENPFEKD